MSKLKKIICLIPVFNDWESFSILVSEIKKNSNLDIHIVVVNDGSTDEVIFNENETNITILNLKINIGHQRAIAVGLQYIYNELIDYNFIVVMDSDGEDKPEHIESLIDKAEELNSKKIIFSQRRKRQEAVFFKIGYFFYKKLFHFLTGQKINFGNFSIIPKPLISKVVHQNNIWNHYSGGIIQSKIPYDKVLLDRGKRYRGVSKMNFNSLILHGLSSIAVYFDYLSLKILRFSIYGILLCTLSIAVVLFKKYITDTAIPGWASSLLFIITSIILQLFSVTLIVLLMQLSSRKNISAPNPKIYKKFIKNEKVFN